MMLLIFVFITSAIIPYIRCQSTCGVPGSVDIDSRIIGGVNLIPFHAAPWQLAVETDNGSEFRLHCGGTVISENWGLTAAHCVTPRPGGEMLLVIAGMYNRSESLSNAQTRFLVPGFITIHPEYDADTLLNDIAVLRFDPPLDLSTNRVKAICLPPSPSTSYIDLPNCFLTGWGLTEAQGELAEALQRTSIDVIGPILCEPRMFRPLLVSETCAFDQHVISRQTACHGDMGGPLSCVVNGRFYAAGIGSITSPNCNPMVPVIYSKVPYYLEWIRQVTGIPPQ